MKAGTERAARWLVEQHRARAPFSAFPKGVVPRTVDAAYDVQDAFLEYKVRACGPLCGWKIALSNPAMQDMVGLPEPVAGRLCERQVVSAPGRVKAGNYGRLLLEFEIAVELSEDLPDRGTSYTRASVAGAVGAVRPAFELIDDRAADYASLKHHALQLVADNAWNEGVVLGERRTDWRSLDLAALRGRTWIDGDLAGEGQGSDLMGHPLEALAWIANHAIRRGQSMRAGERAILGSLMTSKFPRPGQEVRFELEGFAPIFLQVD